MRNPGELVLVKGRTRREQSFADTAGFHASVVGRLDAPVPDAVHQREKGGQLLIQQVNGCLGAKHARSVRLSGGQCNSGSASHGASAAEDKTYEPAPMA